MMSDSDSKDKKGSKPQGDSEKKGGNRDKEKFSESDRSRKSVPIQEIGKNDQPPPSKDGITLRKVNEGKDQSD